MELALGDGRAIRRMGDLGLGAVGRGRQARADQHAAGEKIAFLDVHCVPLCLGKPVISGGGGKANSHAALQHQARATGFPSPARRARPPRCRGRGSPAGCRRPWFAFAVKGIGADGDIRMRFLQAASPGAIVPSGMEADRDASPPCRAAVRRDGLQHGAHHHRHARHHKDIADMKARRGRDACS